MTTSIFSTETLGACREICGKSGSNFTPVFALLPKDQKEAMTVLYSFMRLTDDISDGESSRRIGEPTSTTGKNNSAKS